MKLVRGSRWSPEAGVKSDWHLFGRQQMAGQGGGGSHAIGVRAPPCHPLHLVLGFWQRLAVFGQPSPVGRGQN